MADIELSKVYLQRFSASGDGMHVEICKADEAGKFVHGEPYPIVTIRASQEDELKFVICSDLGTVSIPLDEIERSIAFAKDVVHSENFYD